MGYCVDLTASDVIIRGENVPPAIEALKKLMQAAGENGSGGQFGRAGRTQRWYSCVKTERVLRALDKGDFTAAMSEWRYSFTCNQPADLEKLANPDRLPYGDAMLGWFEGDKWGDDLFLWSALAPFIQSGSYLEWRGEDDEMWRFSFENGRLIEQTGVVVWE